MLVIRFALIASAAALAASPLSGAPAGTASKPDEATVAEAIRLLDVDGFDEEATRTTELMIGLQLAALVDQVQKQFGDTVPADFLEELRKAVHDNLMETLKSHLPQMKRQTAEIYAQEFTSAELARLRQLHSDPVALKARERSKVMQPKLMAIGVKVMRDAQPDLDAKIARLVSDYLAKHGKSGTSS